MMKFGHGHGGHGHGKKSKNTHGVTSDSSQGAASEEFSEIKGGHSHGAKGGHPHGAKGGHPHGAKGGHPHGTKGGHPHGTTGGNTDAVAKSDSSDAQTPRNQSKGYVLVAIVYLLGLFIGSLDTGIVTPGRTVIQNTLNVEDQLGVWMLTIYTLAYAASIPIMGKFADKFGRKYIYLLCV
ncbi:MAG: MFS transporter, partial [Coriobacteriales bacterium]|nr:MFS transporter [Coriobacteriales bacterium]